jgi:hypothetical protein
VLKRKRNDSLDVEIKKRISPQGEVYEGVIIERDN